MTYIYHHGFWHHNRKSKDLGMSSSEPSVNDEKPPYEKYATPNTNRATDLKLLEGLEHYVNGSFSEEDLEIISAHLDDRTLDEAIAILRKAVKEHRGDISLSQWYYEHLKTLAEGVPPENMDSEEYEAICKFDAFLIYEWSIYPEVRAVTRPLDEDNPESYESFRVYFVSILWSCAGSVLATFFAIRFPAISLGSTALQILIAYSGKALAYIPGFSFPLGFGYRFKFGNGPWTFKEQSLATCGMSVGGTTPYSQYAVISMANSNFFNQPNAQSFGFIILLTLASNTMGFGLAGLFRIFLVYPTKLIWYSVFPTIALSRSLVKPERREKVHGWPFKTYEYFWITLVIFFGWLWITQFVFQFLAYFDWMAWINSKSQNLQWICGVQSGLGFNIFPSMDPSEFLMSPLVTPWYSTVMLLIGVVIGGLAICAVFWLNVSYTAYFPINSNRLYDNTGTPYQVSNILNSDFKLDEAKYQSYSLPYWGAGNVVVYGAFFAMYPALIVYAILNYWRIFVDSGLIFARTILHPRKVMDSYDDRFMRAQRRYKEVPEWWYMLVLVCCLAMAIGCVEGYKFTNTPVWTIFFAIGLSAVFMIPSGVLFSMTNQQVTINVLYELIIGITNKGNANALQIAKVFGTNFMIETDTYLSNQKMAHYCGVAPRALFRIQLLSMICNSFVQSGLMMWQVEPNSIPGMCDPDNKDGYTCQGIRTYFNAAVQWGTIGPVRLFRGVYPKMKWCFLIGAGYPLPFWISRRFIVPYLKRRFAKPEIPEWKKALITFSWLNSFNELILLMGVISGWAPYNLMYYVPWLYLGALFQWFLPKYYPRWWKKYNYLTYAGVTSGFSYGQLILFFATQYHHLASISWWGNDTALELGTMQANPRLVVTPGTYFGPRKGTFPR